MILLKAITAALPVALLTASALAQEDTGEGISVATFAVARDSASAQQAIVTGYLIRQSFQRNPRYSVLDVEGFLHSDSSIASREQVKLGLQKLERGRQMYDAFELDPALAAFNQSVIALERGTGALATVEPYVRALQLLGATHALKADRKAARAAFIRALKVNPRASLDGGGFPPTVVDAFTEAKEISLEAPFGSLSIYSNPAAAEVYVDGVFRGSAPLTVDRLPRGRHMIRIVKPGYLAYGRIVDVVEGAEETIQAALKPTTQAAQFESLLRRAGPEAAQDGMGTSTQELGAWLKVDQMMIVQITASGDDVTLQAAHYDAAGGSRLHAATRTFGYNSPRYRANVEEFIVGEFRQAQLGVAADGGTATQIDSGYAPDRVAGSTHPGYIVGGIAIGGGVLLTIGGIVFTVLALERNSALAKMYQVDAKSSDVRTEGLVFFGLATAGYTLAVAAITGAIIAFIVAGSEKESVETILAEPGAGGDLNSGMEVLP